MPAARHLIAAGALALAACAPREQPTALADGRTYTQWLYGGQFDRLWQRFSPEMRRTFSSAHDLAEFAGHEVQQLGPERGHADEQLTREDSVEVYTRAATFARAPGRRMLVQWALGKGGTVTGMMIRPEPGRAARQ